MLIIANRMNIIGVLIPITVTHPGTGSSLSFTSSDLKQYLLNKQHPLGEPLSHFSVLNLMSGCFLIVIQKSQGYLKFFLSKLLPALVENAVSYSHEADTLLCWARHIWKLGYRAL